MVTAAMKIRRHFASWKETYDKPRQYIKKQRHHFVDKGPYIVFLVVIYRCESWTIKKAECQKMMLLNCGAGEDT